MLNRLRTGVLVLAIFVLSACSGQAADSPSDSVGNGLPPSASSSSTTTPPTSTTSFTPPSTPTCGMSPYGISSDYYVDEMKVGEKCYADPHSLWLDQAGQWWLHPKYTVEYQPFADDTMLIDRTDGIYQVSLTAAQKAQYTPSPASPYFDTSSEDLKWIRAFVVDKK